MSEQLIHVKKERQLLNDKKYKHVQVEERATEWY